MLFLQHLSINQADKKPMGDIQSKPIENQEIKHLQQQYEPFSKGKYIPGQPVFLKLNSIFQKTQFSHKINDRFKKLQFYTSYQRYDEHGLAKDKSIYDYRRTNLPCIVQVVYYCIDKEDCECSNKGYRLRLYTQHIQTRLAHYKTTKKTQNSAFQQIQYYNSFSLDEGIYLLISVLHAYELLSQQFIVGYPSAFSIGINNRAQVKAWINDNWSLNNENHRKISENIIIQQIINLIQQRMQGNFNKILNISANYMNFTFSSIQQILAKYTIYYQTGKKSLQDRLNNRNLKDKNQSNIFSQKIPLTKNRQSTLNTNSFSKQQLIKSYETNEQSKNLLQKSNLQTRHFSQQIPKRQILVPANMIRNYSITPRTSINQSPKKIIKFLYQPSTMKNQTSPSTPQHFQNITPFNETYPIPNNYKFSISDYRGKLNTNIKQIPFYKQKAINSSKVPSEYFDKITMNNLIDKKLSSEINFKSSENQINFSKINPNIRRDTPQVKNNLQYNFGQYPFQSQIINTVHTSAFQIGHKDDKNVQFDHNDDFRNKSQQYLKKSSKSLNKTSQNASLSQITQQFKHLLKSDHKIEEKQELFYEYQDIEQIDNDQNLNKSLAKEEYVQSFEEIKQEDEDVSYSIDEIL